MLALPVRVLSAVGVWAARCRPCAVFPVIFGPGIEGPLDQLPLRLGQRGAMRAGAIGAMFADAPWQEMVIAHFIHFVVHQQWGRFVA